MKTLTLFRHAKSSWQYALTDIFRPLNRRGFKQAQFMAQRCILPPPDTIFCSPANRAYSTALFYVQAYTQVTLVLSSELYQKSAQHQLNWLTTLSNELHHVWLFGHNPDLSDLATVLVAMEGQRVQDSQSLQLTTAAYIQLNLPIVAWSELHQGCAEFVSISRPDKKRVV